MRDIEDVTNLEAVAQRGFEELTSMGSLYLVLVYVVTLELIGEKVTGRLLATAAVLNSVVVFGIKMIASRPRPEAGEVFLTSSFPSGHAATAFMAAAVLGHRYPELRYWLLILASVVGVSRLVIGAHFFADVAVGALIGYTIGLLTTWKLEPRLESQG